MTRSLSRYAKGLRRLYDIGMIFSMLLLPLVTEISVTTWVIVLAIDVLWTWLLVLQSNASLHAGRQMVLACVIALLFIWLESLALVLILLILDVGWWYFRYGNDQVATWPGPPPKQ